jgi:hypothetical protein
MLKALMKSLKKALESLNPRILESSSPTKLEKNQFFKAAKEKLTYEHELFCGEGSHS